MTPARIPMLTAQPAIMNGIPLNVGRLHFVGVGGIGMCGIAEILHSLGYEVTGSDLSESANVQRLRDIGIDVTIGHDGARAQGAAVLVVSSAIRPDNLEIVAAREFGIPVIPRAEMLAELMRLKRAIAVAGAHGKTTTTSMIAEVLLEANMDPTIINGGVINTFGGVARLGQGEWIVAEADESDGSFLRLPATVAVVTNIDEEHLDHYGSFENLRAAFREFVSRPPFYGVSILCIDHPEVQALYADATNHPVITYGFSPQADIRAISITTQENGQEMELQIAPTLLEEGTEFPKVQMPMFGRHNAENALAAISIGLWLCLDPDVICRAISGLSGVKRRFTCVGVSDGVTVIDDYAHHPEEVRAVLSTARDILVAQGNEGKIIAVAQPHRYTRLSHLFDEFSRCFHDADHVFIADVYPAGEEPIEGADRDHLVQSLERNGHRSAHALLSEDNLAQSIAPLARSGDMVVCLGAGSITNWAHSLPAALDAIKGCSK